MKIVKNFLDEKLIFNIGEYIKSSNKSKGWYSNSIWDDNIVKNSGLVTILPISDFYEELKNSFINYDKKFENYSFIFQYYKWHRGSYIPWHDDNHHDIGATIYLNEEWDVEDGGIFFYLETDSTEDLKCIYPKYNTLIINDSNQYHHVSLINYHAKIERKTIQIWIDKKTNKKTNKILKYQ